MKYSFALAVVISLIFSFSQIYSQGIFLEKGEFGFYFDGGYSELKNATAVSFGGGVALGGVFEFSFSSTNSEVSLDKYGLGGEVEVNSKTATVGAVLIKKKAQLEINFGFTASKESSDALKSTDALLLGFNVGSEFKLHEKLSWYPIFEFAVGIPTSEDSGNPVTALGLSAPLLIGEHVYLGPSFALAEGDFSWGVKAGILISFDINDNGEDNGW